MKSARPTSSQPSISTSYDKNYNTIELLLSRLDKVKLNGSNRWSAHCPAHEDKSPSLSIKLTPDGKTLLHCFAGCSARDIVGAVGLSMAALFPANSRNTFDRSAWKLSRYRGVHRYESTILSIYQADVHAGKLISEEDKQRAQLAASRINKIERALGGSL